MKTKAMIFVFIFISVCGCKNRVDTNSETNMPQSALNIKELKKYYKTEDIVYHINNSIVYLNVNILNKDSSFLDHVNAKLQQYSSIGALIFIDEATNMNFDSLKVTLSYRLLKYSIIYSHKDLELIKQYTAQSLAFIRYVNDQNYDRANSYLSANILEEKNTILAIYNAINSLGQISNLKLVKFKIQNEKNIVELLINAYYSSGDINTYVVIYPLHNPPAFKIIGISTKA